ncbi:MAG: class I SAM-dependent methyltransferase [Planctomycetota bacterium]|jgi:2-polyprenyl-3-methyl-5-hydroxy-6-metoxy-1,4-benzoquinol methylase
MSLLSEYLSKRRADIITQYIKGSVLDLGCGHALPLKSAQDKISSYYGIEYSQQQVEKLKQLHPDHNFFAKNLDTDDLDFEIKFDTILAIAVIEHILNQKHFLEQIIKNMDRDATVVITTPTPLGDLVHRIGSRFGLFAKSADHRHIIIFSKTRLTLLAQYFNLKVEKHRYFQFGCNQYIVIRKK